GRYRRSFGGSRVAGGQEGHATFASTRCGPLLLGIWCCANRAWMRSSGNTSHRMVAVWRVAPALGTGHNTMDGFLVGDTGTVDGMGECARHLARFLETPEL